MPEIKSMQIKRNGKTINTREHFYSYEEREACFFLSFTDDKGDRISVKFDGDDLEDDDVIEKLWGDK